MTQDETAASETFWPREGWGCLHCTPTAYYETIMNDPEQGSSSTTKERRDRFNFRWFHVQNSDFSAIESIKLECQSLYHPIRYRQKVKAYSMNLHERRNLFKQNKDDLGIARNAIYDQSWRVRKIGEEHTLMRLIGAKRGQGKLETQPTQPKRWRWIPRIENVFSLIEHAFVTGRGKGEATIFKHVSNKMLIHGITRQMCSFYVKECALETGIGTLAHCSMMKTLEEMDYFKLANEEYTPTPESSLASSYQQNDASPAGGVPSSSAIPSEKKNVVEKWLQKALPQLHEDDVSMYSTQLITDGFDSYAMLENELIMEDVEFMKKAHRRALVRVKNLAKDTTPTNPAGTVGL